MKRRALATVACLGCLAAAGFGAPAVRAADSPACTAAKNQVATYTKLIARLKAQLPNTNAAIQSVRARQIAVQLKRDEDGLAAAQAKVAQLCASTGPRLSDYDGTYNGMFVRINITFNVANGILTGDLVNPTPLAPFNAKTGVAFAQAAFPEASCGTFAVQFNAKAGTATVKGLKCTLGGQTVTQDVVAHRQ